MTSEVLQRQKNVYLFVPNIIGYIRIALVACSIYYMPNHPRHFTILYACSCLLDALDGLAARAFNQSTRFGAVLDMLIDRCTTMCLLVFLASAYPTYAAVFQGLISLDYSSHYAHMYATLVAGEGSHKTVSVKNSRLLNFYYKKWVLFVCCAMNELFFVSLYLLTFSCLSPSWSIFSKNLFAPRACPQTAVATGSEVTSMLHDNVARWMLAVSTPIMLFKQVINVVQLFKAGRLLADRDVLTRTRVQDKKSD